MAPWGERGSQYSGAPRAPKPEKKTDRSTVIAARRTSTRRTTSKRTTTKKRASSTAKKTAAAKPVPTPTPGPGEKVFLLDVPFEDRSSASHHGARWYPDHGWAYVGQDLPRALAHYRPKTYSWPQWLQDDLNGTAPTAIPKPDPSTGAFTLRDDQEEDTALLLEAKRSGSPEFLLGSNVGTGKTLVAIAAVKRMPNVRNVLVVCPLSVAPGWRRSLEVMGDGDKRWCIINYESVKKLLTPPASARTAKKTRTKNLHTASRGTPKVEWDVVIRDESHYCGNPESQQTRAVDRIIEGPKKRPAFVIDMSATAGSDPAQLSYLHRGLFWRSGDKPMSSISAEEYQEWCETRGIGVAKSRFGTGLMWNKDQADLTRMNLLIFGGHPKWALRRRPDWPEQQRIPVPVDLSPDEMDVYEQEWAEFQQIMKELDRAKRARASKKMTAKARASAEATARAKGLAAQTRYRQKAGQLRAPYTAAFVAEMVRKGQQVGVSCEYIGTVNALAEELTRMKIKALTFTGENREEREGNRIAFQRGEAQVLIFTPAEGFNLHAGEAAVGGNMVPRVSVVAEPRWSPKKALQIEGRCQRDGTAAPCYYAYATDTVEEKVINVVIQGMKNTGKIMGDDTQPFDNLAATLDVPFVIAA